MDAWTGSDFTMYPFSTSNEKDYQNLLNVYMDATFNPLLTKSDFDFEGHRLEFSQKEDLNSPLEYKGIVYNQMKGAMAGVDYQMI